MTESPSTSNDLDPSDDAKETIIVGLDQSDPARGALTWAAKYARLTGASLRAISIVDWPTGLGAADGGLPLERLVLFPNEEQSQDLQRKTQRIFEQVNPETGWDLQFRVGHVGQILVQVSGCATVGHRHR